MQVQQIELDKNKARELYRAYKKHFHYSAPIDWEIQRTYQLIAQGRVVIRAQQSVVDAGLGEDGYPKLAISRADTETCYLHGWKNGRALFTWREDFSEWSHRSHWRFYVDFPQGSFPEINTSKGWGGRVAQSTVPIIPIHLRPKRGLQNYHILYEAEWGPTPPVDPLLLRRIGKGDMWLVVAAWDLTEVEQAALAARINA